MELLLLMSGSGSLMMVFYILYKVLVKDRGNAKWRYSILKAALFFYLVPVQAVKSELAKVCYSYFMDGNRQIVWLNEDIVQVTNVGRSRISMNYTWTYICFAVAIIIFIILTYRIMMYVKECNTVLKHPAGRKDKGIETFIKRQTDGLGIKRKISCRACRGSRDAFTIGAFHPVIVLDDSGCDGDERELIIRHELLHIKSWDGLVKLLGMIAVAVHFFNPLAYYLFHELSTASELACDEKVVAKMNEEGMKRYCRLLLEMAQRKKSIYMINFGKGSKNEVKERIEMMLNGKNRKKGWQVFSGVVLSFMIVLVSSITTFAYEPPTSLDLSDSDKEIEQGHGNIDRFFVVDGYENTDYYFNVDIFEMSFADSDVYFEDEQGNRYDIPENAARVLCSHNYVSGTYNEHIQKGGACTVYIYNAERCTKCGNVIVKDLYNEINYARCPH